MLPRLTTPEAFYGVERIYCCCSGFDCGQILRWLSEGPSKDLPLDCDCLKGQTMHYKSSGGCISLGSVMSVGVRCCGPRGRSRLEHAAPCRAGALLLSRLGPCNAFALPFPTRQIFSDKLPRFCGVSGLVRSKHISSCLQHAYLNRHTGGEDACGSSRQPARDQALARL
jgi:hypothetical protein